LSAVCFCFIILLVQGERLILEREAEAIVEEAEWVKLSLLMNNLSLNWGYVSSQMINISSLLFYENYKS
jgi:hypothetical protein